MVDSFQSLETKQISKVVFVNGILLMGAYLLLTGEISMFVVCILRDYVLDYQCHFFPPSRLKSIIQEVAREYRDHFHR